MKAGMQSEQEQRSILGYSGISTINDDGRKFGISWDSNILLKHGIVRKARKKQTNYK